MKLVETSSSLHEAARLFIHQTCGSSDPTQFPGAHPVSVERVHIPYIKSHNYVVCEKTDGQRFMLACFTHDGRKYCLFVNRSFDMYIVSFSIPRNTLLEGELVNDTMYMIYDGYMVASEDIRNLSYIDRLRKIEPVTKGPSTTTIKLKMKTMWKLTSLPELEQKQFPYKTDGYIFTPVDEPIKLMTHETMFKWKPLDKITIDFKVIKRLGNYGLYVWHRGSYIYECDIHDGEKYNEKIVECRFSNGAWIPVKIRTDKPMPNNRVTFFRTLRNIRENIQVSEFF